MALTPRPSRPIENQLALSENVHSLVDFFSQNPVKLLEKGVNQIQVAIQHIKSSGNECGGDANDAIIESTAIVRKYATGEISALDANEVLSQLAVRIQANRGFIRAVVGDTISTLTPVKVGVAGALSTTALYWSWYVFYKSLEGIQELAKKPAGLVAMAGAVKNFMDFLPQTKGGYKIVEFIKLGLNPEAISGIVPDISQVEQQLVDAGQVVSDKGLLGTIVNSGTYLLGKLDTLLGGTLTGGTRIAHEEVRHAHAQLGNYVEQASRSAKTATNVLLTWAGIFLLIMISYICIHLFRTVKRRRQPPTGAIEGVFEFQSKRANKKKKSVKRSSNKKKKSVVKKSVSMKNKKKSAKRSPKRSPKRSSKKSPKRSSKKSIRK